MTFLEFDEMQLYGSDRLIGSRFGVPVTGWRCTACFTTPSYSNLLRVMASAPFVMFLRDG